MRQGTFENSVQVFLKENFIFFFSPNISVVSVLLVEVKVPVLVVWGHTITF